MFNAFKWLSEEMRRFAKVEPMNFRNFKGQVFDCRKNYWGHRCSVDNASKREEDGKFYWNCNGHLTPRVSAGDLIIIQFGKGPFVMQFTQVKNMPDPRDMFFGEVKALDYLENLPDIAARVIEPASNPLQPESSR